MPGVIPYDYLDCVMYVYPSADDARGGERLGGSGFLVGVELPLCQLRQVYAVTAWHVIRGMETPVLRVNKIKNSPTDSEFDCLDTGEWVHSAEDDIAVTAMNIAWENYGYFVVDEKEFVDIRKAVYIGPGDEVFMVGRFINLEGEQRNTPTARFGNIAMLPDEENVYLVEHHSLPGYSGSPVFVRVDTDQRGGKYASIHNLTDGYSAAKRDDLPRFYGPWLLGVDSFHIQDWLPVYDAKQDTSIASPKRWIRANSGMAGIVPAWKVLELLNCEKLVKQRESDDNKIKEYQDRKAEEKPQHRSYDSAGSESSPTEFTREDFEAALRKEGRKITPKK